MVKRLYLLMLVLLIAFAVYLRAYTVSLNLPYFYNEDEAHHFNRVVNMVKSGDLNPHYFHKPSLHFYLRMPIVWLSSVWAKSQGHLSSTDEIRTYNKYGVADYAFTASHIGIVKWNRAFSSFLSILLLFFTYLIAKELIRSEVAALSAAFLAAISPALISYSSVIGVDVLMSLMCLVSVYFALLLMRDFRRSYLVLSAIFAGLAVSSKYNALPILAVPVVACYFAGKLNTKSFLLCSMLSVGSFFAASPYILVSIPSFVSQVKYEVWHYAVAGHEGHSAEPGLGQILFYSKWFASDAVGFGTACFALIGFLFLLTERKKTTCVFLSFPILFFLLMIAQKANFPRNVLVLIPFLCVAAVYALKRLVGIRPLPQTIQNTLAACLFVAIVTEPLRVAMAERQSSFLKTDTRDELKDWFLKNNDLNLQVALSGQLQVSKEIYSEKNVDTFDENISLPLDLYLDGYDRLITGDRVGKVQYDSFPYLHTLKKFPGLPGKQRIVINPSIQVLDFKPWPVLKELLFSALDSCSECNLLFQQKADSFYACNESEKNNTFEDYCWITKRFSKISLPDFRKLFANSQELTLEIEAMSPWAKNILLVWLNEEEKLEFANKGAGKWNIYQFKIDMKSLAVEDSLYLYSAIISSPFNQGLSGDKRRLGWAIRSLKVLH